MRILYCNKYNFTFSGTEAYLFSAMDLMRAQGHDTALFSMADERGKTTDFDEYLLPHLDFKDWRQGPVRKAHLAAHALYSRQARIRLGKMVSVFRPDIAHVRNIYHHLSPSILWELKARHVPVVYHLNDFKLLCPSYNLVSKDHACERCHGGQFWRVLTEGCYPGPRSAGVVLAAEAYLHKWLRTYQKCVSVFLAPSQFVKEKLVENGWDANSIEVLPHFQHVPAVVPKDPASDAPILYFGRLSAEKGLTDLLRAMRRVPHVRLQIAGDGPQRPELERLAQILELNNVEFLGHMSGETLEGAIERSRFTVLPSRAYETLGKTILESYAFGRAVVASDLGSRRELVHEGVSGLLYRPGDVEQLAGAISFLCDRPALALEMGAAGREMVHRDYTPKAHYAKLISLYERLACKSNRHATPKPRLKVAFIGGRGVVSKYSGIEAYYEEVGQRLAGMGHQVTVYCRTYFTPPLGNYRGLRIVRLPTVRTKHFETVVHTFLSTLHVSFTDCDIVHYHALGPALFSGVPRWFGKKTVVTVQGLDWQRRKWGGLAAAILRLGEKAAVRLPNQTMVVSEQLQCHYQRIHGQSTIYIPNGTVLRERHLGSKLRTWGLEPDAYILFLGRFSPEKNCHLLVQAFERIATSAKLVLAGGSSYSGEYEKQLHAHASDRIVLLDYVSGADFEELLTNAMLFVLPSDMEGLSLALLEAMGAGVCVLTSDIPENRELVDQAGFTFQRGSVDDLERMLRLLISEPDVRRAAAKRGQEQVRRHYLWPKITRKIETSYLQLCGYAAKDDDPDPRSRSVATQEQGAKKAA